MLATRSPAAAMTMLLVAAAAVAGCASAGYPGLADRADSQHHQSLRVRNDNWQDVRIYLVRESGGTPVRLGSVAGMTTGTVKLPSTSPQLVQLLLRPLGSRASYLTQPVFLEPGRTVHLTVASSLRQSMVSSR